MPDDTGRNVGLLVAGGAVITGVVLFVRQRGAQTTVPPTEEPEPEPTPGVFTRLNVTKLDVQYVVTAKEGA